MPASKAILRDIKRLLLRQAVNREAPNANAIKIPRKGWVFTVREALCMSRVQLGLRLGVNRTRIAAIEHSELSGAITVKSLQNLAAAMGCKFVYAIVPPSKIEEIILNQATKNALKKLQKYNSNIQLTDQLVIRDLSRKSRSLWDKNI